MAFMIVSIRVAFVFMSCQKRRTLLLGYSPEAYISADLLTDTCDSTFRYSYLHPSRIHALTKSADRVLCNMYYREIREYKYVV